MRIHLFLVFFLLLSANSAFSNDSSTKEFHAFLESAAKTRLEQAKKMHEIKSDLLDQEYKSQVKMINEINELSLKMKPGDREYNKKIREQIKEKWKAHKEMRKNNIKKIDELRDEFKEVNKERRKKMRKMMGEYKSKKNRSGSQD